jgi:hypothetical protein
MANDTKQTLLQAAEGLLYPSESDYPFEYVEWQTPSNKLSKKEMRQLSGLSTGVPVQTLSLDKFFEPVTQIQDWYGEEEKAGAEKFKNLKQVLESNLQDIQVFKAGKIEATVYIVGKDAQGKRTGLSTKVVET